MTSKRRVKPFRPVYPSPAALITSCDERGKPNIITLGETFNLSIRSPVILGIAIAPARYSNELIRRTGEFVVNLPTVDILEQVDAIGAVSGRKVDKFAMTGLTPQPADTVRPPLIAECPVNVECKLLKVETVGDHDLFQGEAVAQHVAEAVLAADGAVDAARLRAFAFQFGEYLAITTPLGKRGIGRGLIPSA